jgi:peptide/nickel transport system ATP-binding protein
VFQNPAGALNPRHSVARILGRAVRRLTGLRGEPQRDRVTDLIDSVRLRPEQLTARPGQLSGGMKQRVAIARAFAGSPSLVVCDEPTSALDVSVQAAILNLLSDLQERDHVSYLLISHDLGVVRYLSDRIAVLYLGEVLEMGPVEEVFGGPRSPYTTTLLDAVPTMAGSGLRGPRLAGGGAPTPDGCPFAPRCAHVVPGVCASTPPPAVQAGPDHVIRCHLTLDVLREVSGGVLAREAEK